MKTLSLTAGASLLGLIAGCASEPPMELRNARSAYQDAVNSPGASYAATDVYEAKKSLQRAEESFRNEGDEPETRDLAYVAERMAIIARSKGNNVIALNEKQQALNDLDQWKQQQAVATRQQLGQTKAQLAQSQQQLDSERQARVAAEQRTADALSKVRGLSAKQEERGLVLTLNGSVLFALGKSELLPTAQKRLDDVIAALKDDPRSITIVGHTDSTGNEDRNMALSQKRADAVRTYITTHGIPEDRATAQGMGQSQPVADNKSADGRANNRRVEIILKGSANTQGTPMPGSGRDNGDSPRNGRTQPPQ
jgi:outer membrane protein OmpA-like peptidoglycan-associated protein